MGASPRADHTAIGYGLAEEDAHIASVVAGMIGPTNDLLRATILQPIFGHHGRPIEPETKLGLASHMRRVAGEGSSSAARSYVDFVKLNFGDPSAPPLRQAGANAVSWRLAGLVAIADWIGSNQDFFPSETADIAPGDYWVEFAQRRASAALARCG
jgi:CRISPR-associated endonuclease/helicase Cas3